jgi:phage terminase large subunit-like protein
VRLRHWQGDTICAIYRLRRGGRRAYRQGLLGVARKNSKSLLGAGLAIAGLFDTEGAEVYSCAGDKDQAKIVFGEARKTVEADEELAELFTLYRDAIEYTATGSIYRALSAEAFTKEGLNPSLVIFDEVHVQPNRELWDVMTLGSGTRADALCLGITTAGVMADSTGADSLCYSLYQHGKRVLAGEVDDPTFFFRWYEPPDPALDHHERATWAWSNPALDDFLLVEDFEAVLAGDKMPEAEFRTKRCNQWVASHTAWLPHGRWDACAKPRRGIPADHADIVLGFDGSYSGDSTALVGCTPEGHLFVVDAWEKPEGDDDWRVDIADVEAAIVAACRRWTVLEVACDPFRWQRSMQVLEAEGLPIVEYKTGSPTLMVPACAKFYDAVVERRLSHDGDLRLARHVANAVVKTDRLGPRIVKDHKSSPRKIDLAVAAVAAYDRATCARKGGPRVHDWPEDLLEDEADGEDGDLLSA